MAPQDGQDSADSNSEATTTDTAALQHAPANAARDATSANSRNQGTSDAASTDANSASQAESSGESGPACLKMTRNDLPKRPCLKNAKCLKHSPCLKNTTKDGGGESLATTDCQTDTTDSSAAKPSLKSRGPTERAKASEADSSMPSSSGGGSGSELEVSERIDDASTDARPRAATDKSAGASSADSGGWSISEDCLLRSMKESKDNLPWADIGTALGRTKNDVRARWVVIRDQPAQFAYSEEASGEEQESSIQQSPGTSKPSKKPAKAPDETPSAVSDESQAASEPAKNAKSKGKGKAAAPTKWHKGQRNDKVAMENKSARSKAAEANERERDILSGEEASSESSGPLGDEEDDDDDDDDAGGLHYGWPESKCQDVRYLRNHVYPELYPGMIQPEPDEFFGEHDCAVLAAVDSKYKRSRWLEMQANFYNVTGRMVPLYLIRDKCERAERESAEREQPSSRAGGRWQRVESWVDGVQDGDLEDPAL
ncbi:hypothetical protein HRG_002874 [Hirsutella rhossiliensis]|uniref:Myb-like domain-containing protein n=1 Tax=Hirsutella rhossiliensis TaxID=111463 RepID=A0A9P8MZE7_9HYPO|nr:uncharacterized protein HRG_02874 [Hirsutella rhossiliensis]KAH0964858.1 hypothetical protein HRG_02874 [Hirsutella rhossiliensis]